MLQAETCDQEHRTVSYPILTTTTSQWPCGNDEMYWNIKSFRYDSALMSDASVGNFRAIIIFQCVHYFHRSLAVLWRKPWLDWAVDLSVCRQWVQHIRVQGWMWFKPMCSSCLKSPDLVRKKNPEPKNWTMISLCQCRRFSHSVVIVECPMIDHVRWSITNFVGHPLPHVHDVIRCFCSIF